MNAPASRLRSWGRAALGEPLAWMLVLGVAFFAIDHARRDRDQRRIVVDASVIRALVVDHERRVGKPPTDAELTASIERHVDDEVRVREAERLGLVRGDVIVRRRLLQKMDQILELSSTLDPHAKATANVERVTVEHVYFAASRARPADDAARAADELRAGKSVDGLGDPFPHGATLRARTRQELFAQLGDLAEQLWTSPDGVWSPALRGVAGWHVARVVSRTRVDEPSSPPAGAGAATSASLARLRERYTVEIRR